MKRESVRGWVQRSRTSLWIAVEKGHTRVVDLLVAHDAEIDTPNEVRSCPNTFRTARIVCWREQDALFTHVIRGGMTWV